MEKRRGRAQRAAGSEGGGKGGSTIHRIAGRDLRAGEIEERTGKVDQKGQFWTHPRTRFWPRWRHGHRGSAPGCRQSSTGSTAWDCGSARTRTRDRSERTRTRGPGVHWQRVGTSLVPIAPPAQRRLRSARRSRVARGARRRRARFRGPRATAQRLGEPLIGPFEQVNHPAACAAEERSEFRRPSNLLV